MNAARNNQLPVTAPGLGQSSGSHYVSLAMLREGFLEPAPEPPYVPKPGDLFRYASDIPQAPARLCLYVDAKDILYEMTDGPHKGLRFLCYPGAKFVKL